jgi:hypothetical protein
VSLRPEVLRALRRIDWDFPRPLQGTSVVPHWYPATFPASLPATLVELLSEPGQVVFDPFGGVGTTAAEAIRLGRVGWTNDFNPVATLAAYVGTHLAALRVRRVDLWPLEELGAMLGGTRSGGQTQFRFLASKMPRETFVKPSPEQTWNTVARGAPRWDLLAQWFHERTLQEIRHINRDLEGRLDGEALLAGRTAISASLRSLSSQTRSWGHIADNVLPRERVKKSARTRIARWLTCTQRTFANMAPSPRAHDSSPYAWVTQGNWYDDSGHIQFAPKKRPSLIVCSPPYGGAVDYILSQRLSLYYLGYSDANIAELVANEIGARRKRFAQTSYGSSIDETIASLARALERTAPNAAAAIVVPDRNGSRRQLADSIDEDLTGRGWQRVMRRVRSIRQLRTRQRWTSIKREHILVYARAEDP